MKKQIILLLSLFCLVMAPVSSSTAVSLAGLYQNDLLAEYEQRLTLIEKQFADYKKNLDPKKMTSLDGKMKVGTFENSRNSLKARLRELRKSAAPLSETDRGDLDKRFSALTTEFEQLKKATE